MNKLVAIFTSLLLFAGSSSAQETDIFKKIFNGPTRNDLLKENEQLKAALDSLQILLDSLEQRLFVAETAILPVQESIDSTIVLDTLEYTPEVSDSLLHIWYKNSFSGDIDVVNEYDMDSVSFSSAVSDEQMMKRLENLNSFIALPYNSVVKNYMILYAERMPSKMNRLMGLSEYYFPIFEEAFNKYGIPLELKYMAVVESMLNPLARSRVGALGMWQFMYSTAKLYNLEINSFVDERLDVEKSVDAAARYLRDAYKVFGDWALAISSYNCGAGNVSKAIRRSGGKRDFWSIYPYLPRETRGYVPAFVGAMYAFAYSREYGLSSAEVGMPAQVDTFVIRKNLHFKQISEVVGIPYQDLKNLNHKYVHDIIPGDIHPYVLNLPYKWTSAFVEADKDSLYAYKAEELLSQKVIKDVQNSAKNTGRVAYKVKSGDYLGKIASKYGVSVSKIKTWNNLKSSNIRVGQILYIYGAGSAPAVSSSTSSKSSSTNSSSVPSVYTVKSGDSLYTIAKKFSGVSAEDIKRHNGLSSNNIRPGQKLKIPKN